MNNSFTAADIKMHADIYTIISGTNRPGSNTIRVAKQYFHLLEKKGILTRFVSLEGLDVNSRNDQLRKLEKEALIPARKFIFVVPEYNGSFPGVLKAMIDNTDIEKVWWGKKALLTGVSTGRAGNLRGMEHLTGVLHYLKMNVHHNKLPISVVNRLLNGGKDIEDAVTLKVIDEQLEEFIRF
ncbi:NAD(P)H-dependent oxidoreductase [Agriterribacter sp.]|uniref:NADPH-dependent FMN reductase n=1 Tax=Agriterribacter sp. TaxID=2821509 RepID=UPI002BD8E78B|nr:NAD(P)H-dependent oxidoreductase [Agriterribacter sp.]HRO45138.1 NAD(P)H-dependent oxidoreductase [Agriterribacter sp.]HRQ19514.1 NAD(P)H-dependent oxidoreductase [Agriterribacter sp.]